MNQNGMIEIMLVGILIIIVILLAVLAFIYFKDKIQNKSTESKPEKPKAEIQKSDKKSVFRFMEFDAIEDNMIVQDAGARYLMVIECKGINYDLLSGIEKTSVEEGFIQFLNALKHEIQLYVQTRKVNLAQSTQHYREKLDLIKQELKSAEEKYEELQRTGKATSDEILKAIKEVTKKRNLYEYGKDIVENTEQMAEDRDITTKQYYIVIPYYTEEITSAGEFDKREISSMAFSELYTRAQSIVSSLSACEVRGRILNSQELVELLYVAYNREQYDIYDFETYMNNSEYQSLYTVSENILDKKMKAIDEEIIKKANMRAVEAFEIVSEEERIKRQAIEEKNKKMQEYINALAMRMVDNESASMGKRATKLTKEKINELALREAERVKQINNEKKKVKTLTEEERKRRLALKKKKMKKEREENERKKISKNKSSQ
ncbi:MAG: hypothetical protein J6A89_03485 [Clostridia bacterium]|nr:hypothetical protein [Clostridia bacterium]